MSALILCMLQSSSSAISSHIGVPSFAIEPHLQRSPRTPHTPLGGDTNSSPADSTATARSIKLVVGSRSQKHEEQDRFQECCIGRASSPGSRKSPDADIRVVEPSGGSPCLGSALWTPDAVGNLYVFKGSSVPALLEVYTSPSCDDYIRVQRWLGLWFSTSEGADTITPPMVPVVFPVCDDSDNADNAGDPLARDNYLKRRNLYRRQWMLEASQSLAAGVPGPTFGAPGSSCLVMNGEYITLCELEKLDITPFPKSSSKGVLKVLLADESTVLCTYQPMQSIKSMIGNLVANVAVVGCGARCTCRGHQAYRMDTHHSVVLSTHQMPLVRQDCDSYHVAGLDLARHAMAPSGMQSLGLVVWITHGFIDSTPMAVGYCGLSIPKE